MLRLHQTFGAHTGRVRDFDQDVVRVGRLPTNDMAFDPHADLDASGSHAEIRREAGVWILVDVGSRNGTIVDGRTVQRHVLHGGEEVEFGSGGPRVRVELLEGSGRAARTAPATPMLGGPPIAPAPVASGLPAPALPGSALTGAPKLYGQRTVEQMIQEAVETRPSPEHEAWQRRSRILVFVLGSALALVGVALCFASAVVAMLWSRTLP